MTSWQVANFSINVTNSSALRAKSPSADASFPTGGSSADGHCAWHIPAPQRRATQYTTYGDSCHGPNRKCNSGKVLAAVQSFRPGIPLLNILKRLAPLRRRFLNCHASANVRIGMMYAGVRADGYRRMTMTDNGLTTVPSRHDVKVTVDRTRSRREGQGPDDFRPYRSRGWRKNGRFGVAAHRTSHLRQCQRRYAVDAVAANNRN